MVVGIVLILLAAGWYFANRMEDKQAGAHAEILLEELNAQIDVTEEDGSQKQQSEEAVIVNGEAFCGKIIINKLGVELPVYQEWSYPKLKNAPCRYAGGVETDDMIIAAHNYKHHFGGLKQLEVNDTIQFVDTSGVLHLYCVKEMVAVDGTAVEDMTSGNWDFTLFTCTKGGEQRVTVRCERQTVSR